MGSEHSNMIEYFSRHPEDIEKGIEIIKPNFRVGRIIIDVFGFDSEKNPCLIEIKTDNAGKSITKAKKQLIKYNREINRVLNLFGYPSKICRLIVVRLVGRTLRINSFIPESINTIDKVYEENSKYWQQKNESFQGLWSVEWRKDDNEWYKRFNEWAVSQGYGEIHDITMEKKGETYEKRTETL